MNETTRERDYTFTLALALVALLPRLFVAIAWTAEPVWDGHYYHFGAERIAQGFGYSEDVVRAGVRVSKPWSHYPVGYSAFLGALYWVFGSGTLVAPIVNALIGTLLAVAVHRIARYWLSETRARVAGALCALHPGLIAYSAVVMNELLSALLAVLALWAALAWADRKRGLLTSGFAVGAAVLVRPTTLLAAPLLTLGETERLSRRLLRAAAVTAVACAVALPWSVRNCAVMDGCAFVATNGGWNLAIGALTETGRFTTLRASDGCPVVTGQVQQDRCWAAVGRARILADPLAWIAKIPKKLGQTFDHESFAIEYLHEAAPQLWPEPRRVAGRQLLTLAHRLLLIAAALGVIAFPVRRDRQILWWQSAALAVLSALILHVTLSDEHPFYLIAVLIPVLAFLPLPGRPELGKVGLYCVGLVAVTLLTHAVFFGDDRYHLVVSPLLCVLAAALLRAPSSRVA